MPVLEKDTVKRRRIANDELGAANAPRRRLPDLRRRLYRDVQYGPQADRINKDFPGVRFGHEETIIPNEGGFNFSAVRSRKTFDNDIHRYEGDVNEEAASSPPEAPALPSFDIDPCLVGAGLNLQPYDIALSPKADLRAQDDHEFRNTLEFSHFLGGDDNHAQKAQSGPVDMISTDIDLWMTQGCKARLSAEHASKAVPLHESLLDDGNSSLKDLMKSIPTLLLVKKEQAPWNPFRNASFEGFHDSGGPNRVGFLEHLFPKMGSASDHTNDDYSALRNWADARSVSDVGSTQSRRRSIVGSDHGFPSRLDSQCLSSPSTTCTAMSIASKSDRMNSGPQYGSDTMDLS